MTKTVEQVIVEYGASHVYREVDFEPGVAERMVALGLPAPKSLADVWRAHAAAHAALSEAELKIERNETEVALEYLASACKGGIGPRRPRGMRYTKHGRSR